MPLIGTMPNYLVCFLYGLQPAFFLHFPGFYALQTKSALPRRYPCAGVGTRLFLVLCVWCRARHTGIYTSSTRYFRSQ